MQSDNRPYTVHASVPNKAAREVTVTLRYADLVILRNGLSAKYNELRGNNEIERVAKGVMLADITILRDIVSDIIRDM